MTPDEIMMEAILSREWWDHEKSAHKRHGYDAGCAVCGGYVELIVAEALRGLDMAGMVVVSAEDLFAAIGPGERPEITIEAMTQALVRLRAALPERSDHP